MVHGLEGSSESQYMLRIARNGLAAGMNVVRMNQRNCGGMDPVSYTHLDVYKRQALVLLGFFHSIMFPTIFALSLKNLGPHTKLGSSLLVMSIIGGAVFPAIMGYISDMSSIRYAFWVPFFCHLYVLYFAARGYRPDLDWPKQAGMRLSLIHI